jgi:hypothetical protein
MDGMKKTCPNCVHGQPYGIDCKCNLAVYAINGNDAHASVVRVALKTDGSVIYHSKVTEPCGAEGLYWEDGRAPVESIDLPPLSQCHLAHEIITPERARYLLGEEPELETYTPRKGEKCKVSFEEAAAEMLNDGVSLTSMEHNHSDDRPVDANLVDALSRSFERDVWSKSFKVDE